MVNLNKEAIELLFPQKCPFHYSNIYVTVYCMLIKEYIREDDSNPYEKWFNSLNIQAAAKVAVAIGTKKKQSADIKKAKELYKEYKTRKKGEKR